MKKQAKLWVAAAVIAVAGGSASVAMAATTTAPSMVQKMATLSDKFHVQKQSVQTGQEGKGQIHFEIKGGPNAWQSNTELLTLLHLTSDELTGQLKDGKSLADIAAAQGVDKQQVIDLLVKEQVKQIDDGVAAGNIPSEKAAKAKEDITSFVTDSVNGKQGAMMFRGHGGKGGDAKAVPQMKAMIGGPDLADFLKITPEELNTELQSGKSLLDVATAHNVTKEQLVNFFTEQQTKKLDEALQAGHITQDQYNEMKSQHAEMINNMIEGKGNATFKMGVKQGEDHQGQAKFKSNQKQVPQSESNAVTKTVVKRQL